MKEGYGIVLLAWDRDGHYPHRDESEGIEIHRIGLRCSYDNFPEILLKLPLLWMRMLFWLLGGRFEILHCHDLDTLPLGLFVAKLKRKPCVFDAHELYSVMVGESVSERIVSFLRWLERALVPKPDLLVTVNEILASIYREMRARRVVVVMNSPPEEEVVQRDPQSVRRALGLEGKKVCLYAGVLERSRNLDTLIDVFKDTENGDSVLLLGGHGSLVDHVLRRISGAKNILFVGWIDAKEMSSYLTASDVVMLLYDPLYHINRIGTATRLLEAMALGVPILASEGSSNAEIVRREGVGLCVKHDDVKEIRKAIQRLLHDTELRESIVRNCLRASKEKYSWEVMEMRLLEAYRELPVHKAPSQDRAG